VHKPPAPPAYASSTSITFDSARGTYVGEVISRGGMHVVEGPDALSVDYAVQGILRDEYNQMVREATIAQGRERGGHSRGGSSGVSSHHEESHERINGMKVYRHEPGKGPKIGFEKFVDMVMSAVAISQGHYFDAAVHGASMALGDWYEGVESLWDKKPKQRLLSVSFGGILITATSKAMLLKLLTRQRNIRINMIMTHVRKHEHERENASTTDNILSPDAKRLRAKKKRAEALRPKSWERRMCPQGQQTGWQGRSLDLKDRMKDKKDRAMELWVNRV
jgi:hypothetical protein